MSDVQEIWFERAGARLFATVGGDGPPVILLHGGLANHQSARLYAGPLAAHHQLITPDLRGSGRSIFREPLTWDLLADDIAALAAHLGHARVAVGGASFGAGVAVRVALRHPALVSALIVLQPAYGGADRGLTPAQQQAMDAMHAAGRRCVAEGLEVLFPLLAALPPEVQDRARTVFASYDPASVATSTAFMASGIQPFERGADLAAITAPTLVVPGMDPTHPPELAEVFARDIRDCTVRTADPSGYAAAIAAFLTPGRGSDRS